MKKKIYKIMGVALTFVMVLSLFAFAAPVAADPEEFEFEPTANEWTKYTPDEGEDSDWFISPDITNVGPMALAIDGTTLYAYAYVDGAEFAEFEDPANGYFYIDSNIFKSEDGGRTWATTDFADELVESGFWDGLDPGYVVDIVCDSEDADIVYVATGFPEARPWDPWYPHPGYVYWSEDGGDTFEAMAPDSLDEARWWDEEPYEFITSLDVSYFGDEAHVFVSTSDWSGGGSVYYINLESYLAGWTDMAIEPLYDYNLDAYAVNCAPDFDDSRKVYALVSGYDSDNGSETQIVVNSGTSGVWTQFGENLLHLDPDEGSPPGTPDDNLEIEWGSNICFPDDFDHDELFVGVDGGDWYDENDDGQGSVYRVTDEPAAYRLAVDGDGVDIMSLELTGDVGDTVMLVGGSKEHHYWDEDDTVEGGEVFYSTDDGEEWDAAGKPPSGATGDGVGLNNYDSWTYVLMAEDFGTSDTPSAWAATSGNECAVSYTIDGGDLWNQISLIGTDRSIFNWVSFYPDYEDSGKFFQTTSDGTDTSLWRYDGEENWERVAVSTVVTDATDIALVQVSPEIGSDETVFFTNLTGASEPAIYCSTDLGQSWDELSRQPDEFFGGIVLDADTILAGGTDAVYKTDRQGERNWKDTLDGEIKGEIYSFALLGDNVLCASDDGQVAISEDLGEEWEIVGEDDDMTNAVTYVAFDTDYADNSIIYAANDDDIYRFEVGEDDEWEAIYSEDGGSHDLVASGIATADGCVYVSDARPAVTIDGTIYGDGGVMRSVNPTDDAEDVLFERVSVEFELDANSELVGLQTTSGSNILYALDDASLDALWVYEDALVGPVELESPADGEGVDRTNKLTLAWEELDDVDEYEVRCYADEDFKTGYRVWNANTEDDEPVLILTEADGIEPGTAYWWKVRVAESEPLISKWSVVWSVTTAMGEAQWNPFKGPVNEYPWMGATGVPIKPTFAWNVADWATGYEFELADNDAFSDAFTKELTTTVYQYETNLDYFTTYYWKVRAVSATGTSNWATGVFTTEAEPIEIVAPPPPVEIPPLPAPITPAWIWAIVVIGAILVIAVIILIVLTRRVP